MEITGLVFLNFFVDNFVAIFVNLLQRDMDVNRAYKNIMFATPPSSGLSVPLVCLEGQLEDRLNPISVLAKVQEL